MLKWQTLSLQVSPSQLLCLLRVRHSFLTRIPTFCPLKACLLIPLTRMRPARIYFQQLVVSSELSIHLVCLPLKLRGFSNSKLQLITDEIVLRGFSCLKIWPKFNANIHVSIAFFINSSVFCIRVSCIFSQRF